MNRPIAARIARPFGAPAARLRPSRPPPSSEYRRPRRAAGARDRGAAAAGAVTGALAVILARARLRTVLLALLVCIPLLAGGYMLLRHSSLVAVRSVQIAGVQGPQSGAIEAALTSAAHGMSTLAVNDSGLMAAVSQYPVVSAVHAYPKFPHGLRIVVVEQPPVAAVQVGGTRTAVAADGAVLGQTLLTGTLPTVEGSYLSALGGHVTSSGLLGALAILGAEPAPLARVTSKVYTGPYGLTVAMKGGLLLYFGDASRPHAKWTAIERVLTDQGAAGASAIDARVPERPAAEFASGTPALAAAATGTAPPTSSEATVAALAAGLSEGGAAPASPAPSTTTGSPGESSSGASETPSEHTAESSPGSGSGESTETPTQATTPSG